MRLGFPVSVRFSGFQPGESGDLRLFLEKKLQEDTFQKQIATISKQLFTNGNRFVKGEKVLIALFLLEVERREAEGPYQAALKHYKCRSIGYRMTHRKPKAPPYPSTRMLVEKIWGKVSGESGYHDLLYKCMQALTAAGGILQTNSWETRSRLADRPFEHLRELYAKQLSQDAFSPSASPKSPKPPENPSEQPENQPGKGLL